MRQWVGRVVTAAFLTMALVIPVWASDASFLRDEAPVGLVSLVLIVSGVLLIGVIVFSILLRKR